MRIVPVALIALVTVALSAPTLAAADVSDGRDGATVAKKKCKKKGKKGAAAAKRKCGKKKKGGDGGGGKVGGELKLLGHQPGFPTGDNFYGTLETAGGCQTNRQLSLHVERGATDPVVATGTTAEQVSGRFMNFQLSAPVGAVSSGEQVYVVMTSKVVSGVTCSGLTSNLVAKP